MRTHLSLLRLLAALAALTGASVRAQTPDPVTTSTRDFVGIEEMTGTTLDANLTFIGEDGKPVTLGQLVDKPTLLAQVYFECPGICGPLLNGVMTLIDAMDLEPGKDYQVVTVSFNERDTFEMAAEKKSNFLAEMKKQVPPSAWRFLVADRANIRALTDATGFRYQRIEGPGDRLDFNHPATLTILSPQRMITGYIRGVSYVPADVTLALGEAQAGLTRATRPAAGGGGLLAICFTYDPVQGKKVLNITRLTGIITLALAGVFVLLLLLWHSKSKTAGPDAREKGQDH